MHIDRLLQLSVMTHDGPSCLKFFKHSIAHMEPFEKELIAADCKGEVLARFGPFAFLCRVSYPISIGVHSKLFDYSAR